MPEASTFSTRIDELSVDNGCLLCGCRVVVPNVLRARVLEEVHQCHPGG